MANGSFFSIVIYYSFPLSSIYLNYLHLQMKKIILLFFPLFSYCFLPAQTYTFNGNGAWSNPTNWLNSIKPPTLISPNSIININPISNGQCILDVPITIPATATLKVITGSQFIILGNLTILSTNSSG